MTKNRHRNAEVKNCKDTEIKDFLRKLTNKRGNIVSFSSVVFENKR